jgi:purine nucleoside permease
MKKYFIAGVATLACAASWAFGDDGHSAAAEIAQRRLTPLAQQRIGALLKTPTSLASLAAWADDVREARPDSANWHFVNIPLNEPAYVPARDCQASDRGDCVVAALARLQQEMRCAPTPERRLDALRFAIHFVADVHQPLHAVGDMRGGNFLNVVVEFKKGDTLQATNLHAVWDGGLVHTIARSWGGLVSRVESEWLGTPDAANVLAMPGTPVDWANESHALAQQIWKQTPETNRLDEAYAQAMTPVFIRQIGRAGLRLAAYLNQAYASTECPQQLAGASFDAGGKIPVKVMIINLFDGEAKPWVDALPFSRTVDVPGLLDHTGPASSGSLDFRKVRCTADGICQMITGMGHTNAAASTMALVLSGLFDLSKTYFLIAGIAGIDPNVGTLAAVTWPRYLVDFGIAHEIDPREAPTDWPAGYFGIRSLKPTDKPPFRYKTELYQLDEDLLQNALKVSRSVALVETPTTVAYRARYPQTTANSPPSVMVCDTAAGDTYWHGHILGEHASRWVSLLTDGKGRYCTTQQEDNAVMEALVRGSAAGLLDKRRVSVLRTAANFDRPYPGQTAFDSLTSRSSGGFAPATQNMINAGLPFVRTIVDGWAQWQSGIPAP